MYSGPCVMVLHTVTDGRMFDPRANYSLTEGHCYCCSDPSVASTLFIKLDDLNSKLGECVLLKDT